MDNKKETYDVWTVLEDGRAVPTMINASVCEVAKELDVSIMMVGYLYEKGEPTIVHGKKYSVVEHNDYGCK